MHVAQYLCAIIIVCNTPSSVGVDSSGACEVHGGSYSCMPEFIGPLCDQCQNGYYNYTESDGCEGMVVVCTGLNYCNCHSVSSL